MNHISGMPTVVVTRAYFTNAGFSGRRPSGRFGRAYGTISSFHDQRKRNGEMYAVMVQELTPPEVLRQLAMRHKNV